MKKKIIIALLAIVAVVCCALGLAACGDGNGGNQNGHTHNFGSLIPEQPATCAAKGTKAHYYCADCGKYFDESKEEKTIAELTIEIDPTAHTYGEKTAEQPATCTATGVAAHYQCLTCYKFFDEDKVEKTLDQLTIAIDSTAHTYGKIIDEQPATCAAKGLQTHYLCACGKYFDENKVEKTLDQLTIAIDSTAHTYGKKIDEKPSTCSTTGMQTHYHCACGKYFSEDKVEISEQQLTIPIDRNAHYLEGNDKTICSGCRITLGTSFSFDFYINYYKLKKGDGVNVIVPAVYHGKPVTIISDSAFYDRKSLESITIPDGVTSIGVAAFQDCTSLESVNFGNESKLETIGESAFNSCESLTCITIPDGVTSIDSLAFGNCTSLESVNFGNNSKLETIKDYTFDDCKSLTSITIPDGITSIGNSAFIGCTNLASITIPDSVTYISYEAFRDCTQLIQTEGGVSYVDKWIVSFDRSVNTVNLRIDTKGIAEYAFAGCTSLASIIIPDSVTSICGRAFDGCTILTSITIPNGVTYIGNSAFDGCVSLESVNFGNESKLETIGESAFARCRSLESITIPDGVTSIGSIAFEDCDSLTSVTIGNGVTYIGISAFSSCTSLESINVGGNNTVYASQDGILYNKNKTEIIRVPQTKTSVTIGDGVTAIGYKAFLGCTSLESVNFGNNSELKTIGGEAFWECTNLESVTIPDGVTSIGGDAFYKCRNLANVNFGNNSKLETIGSYAFARCTSLTSITIPDKVISIGKDAFAGCTSLESVTFANKTGWKVSWNEDMSNAQDAPDLNDPAQNAEYLTSTYCDYYWQREG